MANHAKATQATDGSWKLFSMIKSFFHYSVLGYIFENRKNGLNNVWLYVKYWSYIWGMIAVFGVKILFKKGPFAVYKLLMQFPWLLKLLKVTKLMRRMTFGRKAVHLESTCLVISSIVKCLIDYLEDMFYHPELVIIEEDMVPPEISRAMGLNPWMPEGTGLILTFLDPEGVIDYIDEAEHAGINPDACGLLKSTLGQILKGQQPKGKAIVSSNMPCDSGQSAYSMVKQYYNLPTYWIDVPYNFMNSERAESLFVEDLKGMIKFLEEHTPGRMDWNRLKEICENRNRIVELEMEVWDMVRTRPAPLASEAIYFSHFLLFNTFTWHKETVRLWEKLVKLGRKNLEKGKGAVENEKYRAVVWNAPFIHFVDIFNKLENEYGLVVVMDSLSYNNIPLIDTSSPESMLKGLAHIIMEGPMVRNTRGPKENYYDYMFQCWKQFDLDMVWMSNNINCKSAQGMNGMLREMCREKNIPYFVLDYDLLDPRTINSDNMMKQVDHFMENVMKAKRIEK